ncbi:hypothetical protein GH733_005679, partial [Mirounga leonina]
MLELRHRGGCPGPGGAVAPPPREGEAAGGDHETESTSDKVSGAARGAHLRPGSVLVWAGTLGSKGGAQGMSGEAAGCPLRLPPAWHDFLLPQVGLRTRAPETETDIDDRYGDLDSRTDSDIPEIPPSSDRTPEILKKALSGLSSREETTSGLLSGDPQRTMSASDYHWPQNLGLSGFAWTHVTLLITVTQSHLVIQNLFEGMIWFLVPISSVICNDITAYLFGFFFGRTPLIKLSPKKTWEGFIGGFFSTVVFGFIAAYMLSKYQYFVCPVEYRSDVNSFVTECEPSELFQLQSYSLPPFLKAVLRRETVSLYPFQIHSIALSTFASLIGPFGGFFASGFKRAFKIKDFANTIPGHGGIMDRFDCQYLMATFVHVYITSFIRGPNPSKVLQQLLVLQPEQQLNIYKTLKTHLIEKGILQPTLK